MRKTPKEILNASADDRHIWLLDASANEIYEFLRLLSADNPWAAHGRDALNVVLSKENIKLQTDIRDMTKQLRNMTKWIIGLTIVMAILSLLQVINPICKPFLDDAKTSINAPKPESTTNQNTNTKQPEDKKNQINHK